MCPLCRGTMKLVQVGGHPILSTYQCLDCEKVVTREAGTGIESYFEWLMSRTKSKRVAAF
jgi:transposase-like protein